MRSARAVLGGARARARARASDRRVRRSLAGPRLLRAFAEAYPSAVFIEVGSNDGDQHDHLKPLIHSGAWSGIMVEPVPYVFERLRANYGHLDRVALENVAISDEADRMPFFHLEQASEDDRSVLPPWYDAIGSFSLDAVMSHRDKIPDLERRVLRTEVPCITFRSLCERHGLDRFDLLLIDTEGYDWEIIKQVDLASYRPTLLIYEHYHLPAGVRTECREHLEGLGYETLAEGFDTWCLHTDARGRLRRTWARLRPGVPAFSADEHPA